MRGILLSGLRFAVVAAFLALAAGCSVWVMGVVQSFGSQNGPKISTVVGNGTGGYTGDGGPATAAEIHQPYHVAMNSAGILYVSDTDNQVIRKVDTSGTASTFVPLSAGLNSPVGVAVDPSSTNIYVSDSGNYVIRQVTSGGVVTTVAGTGTSGHSGDGGIATSAQLGYPYGVAVDSAGNVYVADMYNSAIRMLSGGNL
ncbi:MAG: SBBP repeat-containing protein, partial [Spirochaetia bacterium]